jgi:hypothetical protein
MGKMIPNILESLLLVDFSLSRRMDGYWSILRQLADVRRASESSSTSSSCLPATMFVRELDGTWIEQECVVSVE